MLQYLGRTTNTRILSVIIFCTAAWLWLTVQDILSTPHVKFNNHVQHESLPPEIVSCNNTQPPVKATTLSQTLFPVSNPENNGSWIGENHKMMRALFRCIELSNCGPNQDKVVILGSFHFIGAFWGWVGGEDIWARSTIQALRDLGYSFVYASNMERIVQFYHMMPDLVKAVIVEGDDPDNCFADEENCILSSRNPDGIPAWKIFAFNFWTGPATPLGRNWTLSPEEYILEGYTPNIYLGYSVEPSCMAQPFIPHADRQHRAYIMTKRLAFLEEDRERAWPSHFFEVASNKTGLQFVMGASDDVDGRHIDLPSGLVNFGYMTQPAFVDAVSKSLVLVGVGRPVTSPTPYEALCLGVPFINPILDWNRDDPKDRSRWWTQHGMLKFLDPPFVYNVFNDDLDGFVGAIDSAMSRRIDRYVLDRMRMSSIKARLHAILETDWKQKAAELLAQRKATGEGPLFIL